MTIRMSHTGWLLAASGLSVALVLGVRSWPRTESSAAQPEAPAASADPAPVRALPPAANLRIRVAVSEGMGELLLDPAAAAWKRAAVTGVLLNRTPRIYQTEPVQERPIPDCAVGALRANGKLYLRLEWIDATRNAPTAPPARTGEGGDPSQLYKRPTGATASFPDAAAVMIPEHWTGPSFPSLLMGDKHAPARLYYWSASRGTEVLTASGRATPQPTGQSFPHRAQHAEGKWTVTMELPDRADGYPVAFAVWDGQFGDRDGLKFFSIWYVLTGAV